MNKIRAWAGVLNHCLPDAGDQVRLQKFFGAFLARPSEYPGFLVLGGNGSGAWVVNGVIWHMLPNNVSEVPAAELAFHPEQAMMCAGMQANFIHDMTFPGAYGMYGRMMRRMVVDGVMVDGDDTPAPRMIVQSRFVPDVSAMPAGIGDVAVVIRFVRMERMDFLWSDLMAEMGGIRAWAREGLRMLQDQGRLAA